MKAIIVYDLPDENAEFKMDMKAGDYYCALCDIDEHCRSLMKHGELSNATYDELEKIRLMMPDLH